MKQSSKTSKIKLKMTFDAFWSQSILSFLLQFLMRHHWRNLFFLQNLLVFCYIIFWKTVIYVLHLQFAHQMRQKHIEFNNERRKIQFVIIIEGKIKFWIFCLNMNKIFLRKSKFSKNLIYNPKNSHYRLILITKIETYMEVWHSWPHPMQKSKPSNISPIDSSTPNPRPI